ncbi:glycosyl hydrolase family 16 [Adhaeribacter aerolatus]|uniref:Glycosyl hydrolase family 16 n=1 Tax=Adhaeribacter aerolatus TaxID=670289 RepID=A0A512AUV8_9BACT|nr:glycoside hydrolase family 16 protein [Adhaeribacter aerolatus]GEO03501.1 glycosyl hydrolase family 16 [Adhaeribacter aerolatus]
MTSLTGKKYLLLVGLVLAGISCKKDTLAVKTTPDSDNITNARPTAPTPAPTVAVTDSTYNPDNTTLTQGGWTLYFEDNFDNLDLTKWNIWTGGAFNNELQYYQPQNVAVTKGKLLISARKETVTGPTTPFDTTPKTFQYTSGRLESKKNVSASTATPRVRMMARLKLASGYGMWPAFWSYGDPWPTQGEIDMVEARGQEPTKYQTNYFYGKTANRNVVRNATGYLTADTDLTASYHVYELIWEKDKLTSYLDSKLVEEKTSGGYIPSLFGKSERITLNLAVGGGFFNNLDPAQIKTGTFYIDWVKVFTAL